MTTGYPVRHHTQATNRFCQTLKLKNDSELIKAYTQLHSKEQIWPETLTAIKESGILEMEIYIAGNLLFMIVELPADLTWEEAMEKMSQMPKQKEWEEFVAQYQEASKEATSDEKWQMMERIFHIYE